MKLLLDTHTLLWLASGDVKLTQPARKAIADPANALTIRVATHLGTGDQDYEATESVTIKRTSGYLPDEMPGDIRD